jgi:predicted phage tail protein
MFKKAMYLILSGVLTLNLCGCFALFAGVAGGAGTAVWLSGKLTQEFHASYHATIDATKSALQALSLQVVKETQGEDVTQIKGLYSDGREMWVDIHRITDYSTKVEVRIGGVNADKEAAGIVLKKIQGYL